MQIGVVVPKADVKLPEAAEQVWARLSTTPFLRIGNGCERHNRGRYANLQLGFGIVIRGFATQFGKIDFAPQMQRSPARTRTDDPYKMRCAVKASAPADLGCSHAIIE